MGTEQVVVSCHFFPKGKSKIAMTTSEQPSMITSTRMGVSHNGEVSDKRKLDDLRAEKMDVSKCVIEHIWPKKKFFVKEIELDYGGLAQKCLYHKLGIPDDKGKYWEKHRETVRHALKRKRNNVTDTFRAKLMRK